MNEAGVEVAAAVHTLDLMEFTCTQTSRRTPSPHLSVPDLSILGLHTRHPPGTEPRSHITTLHLMRDYIPTYQRLLAPLLNKSYENAAYGSLKYNEPIIVLTLTMIKHLVSTSIRLHVVRKDNTIVAYLVMVRFDMSTYLKQNTFY